MTPMPSPPPRPPPPPPTCSYIRAQPITGTRVYRTFVNSHAFHFSGGLFTGVGINNISATGRWLFHRPSFAAAITRHPPNP